MGGSLNCNHVLDPGRSLRCTVDIPIDMDSGQVKQFDLQGFFFVFVFFFRFHTMLRADELHSDGSICFFAADGRGYYFDGVWGLSKPELGFVSL